MTRREPGEAYWAAVRATVDTAPPLPAEAQHVIATVLTPEYQRVIADRKAAS